MPKRGSEEARKRGSTDTWEQGDAETRKRGSEKAARAADNVVARKAAPMYRTPSLPPTPEGGSDDVRKREARKRDTWKRGSSGSKSLTTPQNAPDGTLMMPK